MKFEGKEMEIRPLDNLYTRKETQDMGDLEFIGYHDLFTELYEKVDSAKNISEREESVERLQVLAKNILSENENLSLHIYDSISRKKDLREDVLNFLKEVDNRQVELFLKLKEKVLEFRGEFKKDIEVFLQNLGEEKYDLKKVDDLIEGVDVRFYSVDIENPTKTMAYNHSTHFVLFYLENYFNNVDNFKITFYHEFLHVLTNDYENIISYKNKSNNISNKGNQSSGVMFSGLSNHRFIWLNEAVTESLTIKLNNAENSKSYNKERKLLDLLNQKKKPETKLDFNLLTKIYFRHLKIRQDDKTTAIDEWREFSKEVDLAFGPKFLVKLDLFIEKNGIKKALEIITSWPDGEPNIDDLKTDITGKD